MKQLQNNFTTPEQSKKLLELGVPADSADMFYNRYISLSAIPEYSSFNKFCDIKVDIPCWSTGRLIEIYNLCASDAKYSHGVISFIIHCFEVAYKYNALDFSKLEE